ncbi:ADP-ribosylglycohydrolase family protein [Microbacterium sp. zg-B96]|uniref:ADP-ribosylglycohydrolase family protein n=1 Tax=Microbacterium sp. zg-B96 TaxID=3049069 RepID=UPI00214C9865|nr:ADP-ribosylglycohydrolase family protein [Microbacterium sp. zg-B96]MCR2784157.1 ADP-ribosylglycohydrolase family protein [Microbacterium sp. zg.B96]WIM17625.1 ADP-ribosylglycohydrolase family protein [Microbacterium sp. zg-B96]
MHLSTQQLDRAVGVVLASAAGDALGSQYEFGPPLDDAVTPEFGVGVFGHEMGEWTDDTSMAMPILQALADGRELDDDATLDVIVTRWQEWALNAKDVGSQTRGVLSDLSETTAQAATSRAESFHRTTGRSAGNGSLMRTGPVALGYLDRAEEDLANAAGRIAQLTHWEDDNVDACVIWCLTIRHAVLTGTLDVRAQIGWVPIDRRARWQDVITEALAPGMHPRDFRQGNGWVVRALQAALSAVAGATSLRDALERAVRGGQDTDTVASIAGSLAGAMYGGSAVPLDWKRKLHGWPGVDANDLTRLACLAARHGQPDSEGWPSAGLMPVYTRSDYLFRHPHDAGVWVGSLAALARLPREVDAVVSLCRVGTEQVPHGVESVQVWLVDQPHRNDNLDAVLTDAADVIADLRAAGHTVFVHCAEGRSRTSAVAALYGARHHDVPLTQAWQDVQATLPRFAPQTFLREAVERMVTADNDDRAE